MELKFKAEKYEGASCYSTCDFPSMEKALSYIGDCKMYRILDMNKKELINEGFNIDNVPERFL